MLGAVKTPTLRNALYAISRQFEKVEAPKRSSEEFADIVGGSPEATLAASDGSHAPAPGEAAGAMAPAAMGKQEALKRFSVDLTERARDGRDRPDRRAATTRSAR